MDQKKIGSFLKELRNQKGFTQEQIAEQFCVSSRTVSRWENGNNMPDISLLVEISEYYEVSITEIINGERKSEIMKKDIKEIAEAMSDYAVAEKQLLLKRVKIISIIGLVSIIVGLIMEVIQPEGIPIYETIKGTCIGLGVGALVTMVMYTTGVLAEVRKRKSKYMKIIAIVSGGIVVICLIGAVIASI